MAERPTLLLLTRNFPPLQGGMERLNWHLAAELARDWRVMVLAPEGARDRAPGGVEVRELPLRPLWRFLALACGHAVRLARNHEPRVVLAGSGLTAPMAWLAARSSGARAVAYVHGLDVVAPHPVYRLVWRPWLKRMDRVIANSHATAALARQAGVAPERLAIVHPGVKLPPPLDSEARAARRAAFRTRHGFGPGPLMLSVGRMTARKGVLEFVRDVLPAVVAARPDATLAIVGDCPRHALGARAQAVEDILAVARSVGVGDRVRHLGSLTDDELEDAYVAADLHVFPVRPFAADPEGFGMVAIEAAAHGLATVAYATGGVTDAVAQGISGRLVPPNDAHGFARAVLALLDRPLPEAPMRAFAARFAWERFSSKVQEVLSS